MKKIFFPFFLIIQTANVIAQSKIFFEKEKLSITRSTVFDKTIYIKIKAVDVTSAQGIVPLTVVVASNDNPAEYILESIPVKITVGITEAQVGLTIKKGNPAKDTESVKLIFTDPLNNVIREVLLNITAEKESESTESPAKLMLLNAYNFDFGQSKLNSNYVGHLNFFAPSLSGSKWGFNTGLMKIDYRLGDSLNNVQIKRENVTINPLDDLKDSSKYLKQLNSYQTETRNTIWSFYLQSLYELTSLSSSQHVYWHTHFELLAANYTAKSTKTNLAQDTGYYKSAEKLVIQSGILNTSTYNLSTISGYFGTGLTFSLTPPWEKGSFFFQPTIGLTSNSILVSDAARKISLNNSWHSFYLVRAHYTHLIGKESSLVIGVDIRGLFPLYAPQYAIYTGLNIGLDAIVNLVK